MSDLGTSVNVKGYMGDVAILEADKDKIVIFHKGTIFNRAKSKETGTPIYDEVDFCKIITPGEPHNVWDQPVREEDKRRFPETWANYQRKTVAAESGTPTNLLFPDQPGVVATLKAMNVTTIQQLANLSDNAIGNVPFGHDLREKGRQYINATRKTSEEIAEITERTAKETADLRQQIEDLKAALEAKKKPGRPPKVKDHQEQPQA